MRETDTIEKQIFSIKSEEDFNARVLETFYYQYTQNSVYHQFVDELGMTAAAVKNYREIPFLPIEFFKTHKVVCGDFEPETIFQSSGTTGITTSHHFVKSIRLYEQSLLRGFELFFGRPGEYVFLALLPSYLERTGSSLVQMADLLIRLSNDENSGFYLNDYDNLATILTRLKRQKKKVILLGVTYALLDLAEQFPMNFPGLILMETGGMKGKRREMIREELHASLQSAFGVEHIFSEYGMTELLSQAYSKGRGIFSTPPWMKVLIRDINDPLSLMPESNSGGINVIDLANIHSCSFIATQDLGKLYASSDFEVLGRFDNSDVRGCNLLVR
ncbi:MAG: acyltransferase [bacterium]|nr:MAG: acyltransferase [bacterium]